jgi:hypothetical protein
MTLPPPCCFETGSSLKIYVWCKYMKKGGLQNHPTTIGTMENGHLSMNRGTFIHDRSKYIILHSVCV